MIFEHRHNQLHECGISTIELEDDDMVLLSGVFQPKTFLVLLNGGLGYEFPFTKKANFIVEPMIEYGVNGLFNKNSLLRDGDALKGKRFIGYGVLMGIKFSL